MNAIAASSPPASLEVEVRRLQDLQKHGRHSDALREVRPLLQRFSENRDLILIEAASLRHLKKIDEALSALDRLEKLQPRFSQLHQQRGLCYVALKDAPNAIQSLLRAV